MSSEDPFNEENDSATILNDVDFELQVTSNFKSNILSNDSSNGNYNLSNSDDYGLTNTNKNELIQLIINQLKALGLNHSSEVIASEFLSLKQKQETSLNDDDEIIQKNEGPTPANNHETQFFNLIKFGDFENAEQLIIERKIPIKENIDILHLSTHIKDPSLVSIDKVLFKIHEIFQVHKLLEILIFENNVKLGIDSIKKLQRNSDYYAELITVVSDVKCKSHPLIQRFGFYKDLKFARNHLIQHVLPQYLDFKNAISDNRLLQLINQAKSYQTGPENNLFGSSKSLPDSISSWSLFKDYRYPIEDFPCKVIESYESPPDTQIWSVNFSHDGKYLATISNTNYITVYSYKNGGHQNHAYHDILQSYFIFKGHSENVIYLSWNAVFPNQFITCSFDNTIRIWDVQKKVCIKFIRCSKIARVVHWANDGKGFYCGSNEMELSFYNGDVDESTYNDETPKFIWNGLKVADFEVTKNGKYLISSYKDCITVISLKSCLVVSHFRITKGNATSIKLTSFHIDEEQSTVMINVLPNLIQLYNWKSGIMIKQYVGLYQDKYIIRSCFLPDDEQIICCGSVDGRLFFWSKERCNLLLILKNHQGLVNSVAYKDGMLFSAGDDGKINVWGSSKMLASKYENEIDEGEEI